MYYCAALELILSAEACFAIELGLDLVARPEQCFFVEKGDNVVELPAVVKIAFANAML